MKTITIKDITINLSDDDLVELKKQLEEKPSFPKLGDIGAISWYYVASDDWEIMDTGKVSPSKSNIAWIRPTKELCEASIALAKLIYLRNLCNDWWVADWRDDEYKYCIYSFKNEIYTDTITGSHKIIAFKDRETRDWFLEAYRDLITQALPLI